MLIIENNQIVNRVNMNFLLMKLKKKNHHSNFLFKKLLRFLFA